MSSWLWGASVADEAIDKATSELLPVGAEDIALNLEICDQIRSKTIPTKDAVRVLKRRLSHKNPNVQLLALGLTDVCVKNGGDHFLVEIAARDFMDNLVSILRQPGLNLDVKNKMLRLIQNWALAFESKHQLSYVPVVYKELQTEGFKFPPKDLAVANSAMVDTKTAPEWIDSDVCLRCRTPFTFTNRKHHCRNCGQVFDQQCSAKMLPLPHFGITQEVRVCDNCFPKLTRQRKTSSTGPPKPPRHSRPRPTQEVEDAELQRAIELSLQEAGGSSHPRPGYVPHQPTDNKWRTSEPPHVNQPPAAIPEDDEDDPDLRAAIEASLKEANAAKPSAPYEAPRSFVQSYQTHTQPQYTTQQPIHALVVPALPNHDLEILESDTIMTYNQTVEQVQTQNRPELVQYPAISELHRRATGLAPKLDRSIDDTERKERLLEEMNAKLSQAVRLYDSILTQQVARPTWRAQQPTYAPSAPYQYAPQQVPSQPVWTPAPAPAPPATQQYQQSYVAQQPSSPVQSVHSYAPTPAPPPTTLSYQQSSSIPVSITALAPPMSPSLATAPPLSPTQVATLPSAHMAAPLHAQTMVPQPPQVALPPSQPQRQYSYPAAPTREQIVSPPPIQQPMPAFPNVPSFAPLPIAPTHTPSSTLEQRDVKEVALIEL